MLACLICGALGAMLGATIGLIVAVFCFDRGRDGDERSA